MSHYDTIVIGVGAMGSAACYHLARRGVRVLGIEQFEIGHDRGSSHGQTRIIRKAYFEHPDYVPLMNRAYELWADAEAQSGKKLFERCGLLLVGRGNGTVIPGVKRAAREHALAIESVSSADAAVRFPGFRVSSASPPQAENADNQQLGREMEALYEADAGVLRVEQCVQAHAELARAHGAEIVTGRCVESWDCVSGEMRVRTVSTAAALSGEDARREHTAGNLVVCGGPWSARLLAELRLPLQVRRKVQLWFKTNDDSYRLERGCPAFCFDTDDGFFYGAPEMSGGCMKIAEHSGGLPVDAPASLDRELSPRDIERVARFAANHLPRVTGCVAQHAVCMYTMTPDEHFIIDRHPTRRRVFFAAGFSGHGFKFAPVVGSALADLATEGRTTEPIGFLAATRPSLIVAG